MTFCFIHASDLHLDHPVSGVGALPEPLFERVRDASLHAFDRLVDLAIERDAAFLLIGGDVYEGLSRGIRAQQYFLKGVERLHAESISVFMVRGDCDMERESDEDWPAVERWPESFTLFDSKSVTSVPVERDGECLAVVHGVSFARRKEKRNLSLHFKKEEESAGLQVALLHCDVNDCKVAGECASCTVEHLGMAGMDYWALGHCHLHREIDVEQTRAFYAGTHQGRGFSEEESGAKGVVFVEATREGVEKISFEPVDALRFVDLEVDLSSCDDYASALSEISRSAEEYAESNGDRTYIMRTTLRGCAWVVGGTEKEDIRRTMREDLRKAFESKEPLIWWEKLEMDEIKASDHVPHGKEEFAAAMFAQAERLAENWEKVSSLASIEKQALAAAMKAVMKQASPEVPDLEKTHTLLAEAEVRALLGLKSGDGE